KLRRDKRGCRSLTVWFRIRGHSCFDPAVAGPRQKRIGNDMKSAKIELCVICRFSLEKRLEIGRTCVGLRAGTDYRMVRFCRPRSGVRRKLWSRLGGITVFNGEFDSGSERTLAAWIRHASRAGFPLVAI